MKYKMKRSNLFILCIVFVLGFLVYGCYQGYHSYKKKKKNKELYTIIDDINRLNNNISQLSQNSQIDPQLLLNYSNVYSQYVRSLQNLQGESTYNATLGSFICPNPKVYGQMPNTTGGSILCTTGTMVRYDCITGTWGSCVNGIQVRNDFPAMNGGTPCDTNVKKCVPSPPEFMQTPSFGSSGLAFYINDKTNIINRDVIDYPIYFKDGNLFTKLSASNMTLYLPTLYNATYYRGQLAIPLKDANLIPGQRYTFTVKARNNVGESVGVDSLPVVAMDVPSIAINSVIPSTTSLQVNYNISGNFCNIFQGISSKGAGIYMSTDGGTTFSYKVPYYSTNPTGSYNITGLTSNKNYNIKLRTTCSLGAFYSNVVNVTTSQNCMGSWVNSGTCDKNTGLQLQTWNITQPAMYGGAVCSDGSLTNLTAGSTKNIPCLVDCEYTWPTNWSTCSGGTQYKDPNILFNPQNGGAACPTRQTQTCTMPTTSPPTTSPPTNPPVIGTPLPTSGNTNVILSTSIEVFGEVKKLTETNKLYISFSRVYPGDMIYTKYKIEIFVFDNNILDFVPSNMLIEDSMTFQQQNQGRVFKEIAGLTPNTYYKVAVSSATDNDIYTYPPSLSDAKCTLADFSSNIQVSGITNNQMNISWSGEAESYVVNLINQSTNENTRFTTLTKSVTATGLLSNTDYYIVVVSINKEGLPNMDINDMTTIFYTSQLLQKTL